MFGLERSLGTRLITYADDLVILCRRGKAEAAAREAPMEQRKPHTMDAGCIVEETGNAVSCLHRHFAPEFKLPQHPADMAARPIKAPTMGQIRKGPASPRAHFGRRARFLACRQQRHVVDEAAREGLMRPVDTEREAETSRLRLDGFGGRVAQSGVPANRRRDARFATPAPALLRGSARSIGCRFPPTAIGVVASRTQPPASLANITSQKRRTSIVR